MIPLFKKYAARRESSGPSSVSKNLLFGTLTDVKKAPETSSSRPSAYIDTVGRKLRRKLKCNIICEFRTLLKIFRSENQSKKARKSSLGKFCILTVRGFIDSLNAPGCGYSPGRHAYGRRLPQFMQ